VFAKKNVRKQNALTAAKGAIGTGFE